MRKYEQKADGNFTVTDDAPVPFERGRAIEWGWIQIGANRGTGYTSNVDRDDVVHALKDDAAEALPPGARFELRERHATNYGRTRGMAWYHHEDFAKTEMWGDKIGLQEEGMYLLVGQFTTPTLANKPLPVVSTKQEIV